MQKTLTIRHKKFTGKMISKIIDVTKHESGEDYAIFINGVKFWANYRDYRTGEYFTPVCSKNNASVIALMPDDGYYNYSIWLWL